MQRAPIMLLVAERIGKQIVLLPVFYAMNEADVERTYATMRKVLAVSLPVQR